MKKFICILLCFISLVAVPFKGYASSAVFFGMSEELVLGYLASLLGLSATQPISSYDDLIQYNTDLRYGFTEYLAGSATSMELAEWIGQAVIGNINTDSIIWQKFYDFVLENYVSSSGGIIVGGNTSLSTPAFQKIATTDLILSTIINFTSYVYDISIASTNKSITSFLVYDLSSSKYYIMFSSPAYFSLYLRVSNIQNNYIPGNSSYTLDSKNVNFAYMEIQNFDSCNVEAVSVNTLDIATQRNLSWVSIYGDSSIVSDSFAEYSNVFSDVLTSEEKQDIIDGTSVLQLYNPAKSQNGLHIVPDPEDPQDIVIPAMLTADWYNFLQQFGSGAQSFVSAYNALNAVEGVSTGAINGLYNNLGIASALNSAAAAAQGTLSLTDNNIFPQVTTVADAVTGVIPGALTPVAPDSGITNDSDQGLYKLPDLRDFFPFCIPFDFIDLLSCFVAEPETPEFVIALSDGSHLADHEISLESFDNIASIVRTLELALFILGLMLITRNLIRG